MIEIKIITFMLLTIICLFAFTACECKHKQIEVATCTEPQTCTECGFTEGEPLGHDWQETTCTEPKTCKRCGVTEGEPLDHSWKEADCFDPKICTLCGVTEGEPAGHDWEVASCSAPKTCKRCGETEGDALEHIWTEATCAEPKTCTLCGATEGEALGHKWIDKTCTEPKTCSVCGATAGNPAGHKWKSATIDSPKTCEVCGATEGDLLNYTYLGRGTLLVDQPIKLISSISSSKSQTVCSIASGSVIDIYNCNKNGYLYVKFGNEYGYVKRKEIMLTGDSYVDLSCGTGAFTISYSGVLPFDINKWNHFLKWQGEIVRQIQVNELKLRYGYDENQKKYHVEMLISGYNTYDKNGPKALLNGQMCIYVKDAYGYETLGGLAEYTPSGYMGQSFTDHVISVYTFPAGSYTMTIDHEYWMM